MDKFAAGNGENRNHWKTGINLNIKTNNMKQIKSIMLAAALLASQAVPAIKVHTIGDSTMATYDENTTVTRGWGQMFQQFSQAD